ncbi:MAG: MFS transporter [Proteobacteria bacterium]|nr:MFS transporter [Pseudomonadota bacterium]HQR04945.1 MFS transporter [Rhodocyclaceae bacterium]
MPLRRLAAWYFCYFAFLGAFNTYFGLYLKGQGISAWDISILLSLLPVMRTVAPYFWGWLADRRSTQTGVVRMSALGCSIAFAAFLVVDDFPGLLLVTLVVAFFWSAALPLVESLTLAHLRHRTDRYGHVRLWGSIGFIVAVQGLGILLDFMPTTWLVGIYLALLCVTAVSALSLQDAPSIESRASVVVAESPWGQPRMRALLGACFMMSAAHAPLYVFYSIHLVDHGYSTSAVGALWALGVMAEILVFIAMPRCMQAWSLTGILQTTFVLAVLRFLIIGWMADEVMAMILAQMLHGATFGACHGAVMAALNRWFDAHHQGRAQALYSGISFGGGGVLGGLVAGFMWDRWGAGWTYSFAALAALLGLSIIRRGFGRD